ncbi:DUF924 family protein [Ferrimonas marina]|uniref:Uncharacterized conserved protein, DUF924 family n=1 Tax=Ferrimonas marina TaxID=299255 RepID=A0A1M5YD74_9GAMM|nr:DUF924 family protein [Ferrimonas marina]SHI09916.1 Uncharacterized conserved protein, DUF924 family [Ferrimonas marina]
MDINHVIDFWFGRLDSEGLPVEPMNKLWFGASELTDSAIRLHFGKLHRQAVEGELGHWLQSAEGRLALIILLDQFSRNIFRGKAEAFAYDATALALCKQGIELGLDKQLALSQRLFFYMPLQHSEQLEDQLIGVAMLERMMAGLSGPAREQVASTLRFQKAHLEIIERFGRFPHRNAVLGRRESEEERAYLAQGGARFGQ